MITLCINSVFSEELHVPLRILFLITLILHNPRHILVMKREDNLIPTMLMNKLRYLAIKSLILDDSVFCIVMDSKCLDKVTILVRYLPDVKSLDMRNTQIFKLKNNSFFL